MTTPTTAEDVAAVRAFVKFALTIVDCHPPDVGALHSALSRIEARLVAAEALVKASDESKCGHTLFDDDAVVCGKCLAEGRRALDAWNRVPGAGGEGG